MKTQGSWRQEPRQNVAYRLALPPQGFANMVVQTSGFAQWFRLQRPQKRQSGKYRPF